jgi:hypothetical protein
MKTRAGFLSLTASLTFSVLTGEVLQVWQLENLKPFHHAAEISGRGRIRSAIDHWLTLGQSKGRTHQRKMTECLREVAELSLAFRVILLSKQPKVVAGGGRSVEHSASILLSAHHLIDRGKPE